MATFSLKFPHRTAVYVLLALAVLIAYRIFNQNTTLTGTTRSNIATLSRVKKEFPKLEVTSTSRKQRPTNVNLRQGKSISALHEKFVKLSAKLQEKNAIIKQLLSRCESTKIENSKLKKKISDLESKNKKLRTEVKRTLNSSEEKLKELPLKKQEIIYQFNPNNGFVAPLGKDKFKISEKEVFKTFTRTHIFESDNIVPPKEFLFRGARRNMRATKSLLATVKPSHRHILEAEEYSLGLVNSNSSYRFRREHIVDGVYRFDAHTGVDYEIYLRHPKDSSLIKVRLARTLFPLRPVLSPQTLTTRSELINLILPLAGRTERFNQFMDQFVEVCINKDKNVFLTVVLYGKNDFENVNSILKGIEETFNFNKYRLIRRDGPFSRGRALHDGVMNWSSQSNVLMFFCDVDITFRAEFLERCRMYSEPTQQVYYPMVFSLYNPRLVYEDNDVPSLQKQTKITRHHGIWRMFGYGMTCQYRDDYLAVGGFDLKIEGWGSEDRLLYHSYLANPRYRIIRAPDRHLFHHWHEKHCDPNLTSTQYKQCIGSKARTEGSLVQLGMQLEKLMEKVEKDDKDEEPTEE